jgi:hypothetical protein
VTNPDASADARVLIQQSALDRALLGARWLGGALRPNGAFFYIYDPVLDEYEPSMYNLVRHAGTAYSLFQLHGVTGDAEVLRVGDEAVRFLHSRMYPVEGAPGLGYYDIGKQGKLGGQALALVALLQRRAATGDTVHDQSIKELADLLLWLVYDDTPGGYHSHFTGAGERIPEPVSEYFPGEALLALSMLATQFPDAGYLKLAIESGNYLIHEVDGDFVAENRIPREDHWLAIAMNQLYRLHPDPDFKKAAYLNADIMTVRMWPRLSEPLPAWGERPSRAINFTSFATKGEAQAAAAHVARFAGDDREATRFRLASFRTVEYLMRAQYTEANTRVFVEPSRAIGGWAARLTNHEIRIDQVQHNISALIGAWELAQE